MALERVNVFWSKGRVGLQYYTDTCMDHMLVVSLGVEIWQAIMF